MEKRNAADAHSKFLFNNDRDPQWSSWKVDKAVSDGYIASGWVYRAVNIISNAASTVQFHVEDKDGNPMPDHNVSKLLANPNPSIPRQELFGLFVQWLMLAGNAYAKKVIVGGRTTELWAISPDKISPVIGGEWVDSYAMKKKDGSKASSVDASTILHLKLSNPANPIIGVSPLQAAAKPVDTDVEQQAFNKIAMKNRGIMDGVFVFKNLAQSQWDAVREKVKEMFTGAQNARTPGIIGAEADYIRTGLTPAEMDFIESRKFNRDEILLIFGVPPQLVGVQESSTLNNFNTSRKVFWEETVIPLLVKMRDTLGHSLRSELSNGERIVFDVSNIHAMQESTTEKIKVAKNLWSLGIPFSVINKRLELSVEDFEGSDLPWGGKSQQSIQQSQSTNSESLNIEVRSQASFEKTRSKHEKKASKAIAKLFDEQRKQVVAAIKNNDDPHAAISNTRQDWIDTLKELQLEAAKDAANES